MPESSEYPGNERGNALAIFKVTCEPLETEIMLLLPVVVVLFMPGGRSWARSLESESLGSVGEQVRRDIVDNEPGKGHLQDARDLVRVDVPGDFNARVSQWSVLDNAARSLQTWLKEYIEDNEEG